MITGATPARAKHITHVIVVFVVISFSSGEEDHLHIVLSTMAKCESWAREWKARFPDDDVSCVITKRRTKVAGGQRH
jgi:hypothetical protein